MKFLNPVCNCNKTFITDILNVKKALHKGLPSTTLCATPQTLQKYWYHGTIISQIGDMCLPAGNGDKNARSRKWRLFEDGSMHWSALFDDVISDKPALSCGIWKA